jgi:hypothetical protein
MENFSPTRNAMVLLAIVMFEIGGGDARPRCRTWQ